MIPPADLPTVRTRYDELTARGLALDMTRGLPSPEQLALSEPMLSIIGPDDTRSRAGVDARNYGDLEGLVEARELFASMLGVDAGDVVIGENSSLALMHDVATFAVLHGVPGSDAPWGTGPRRFLCPTPGYDRHFRVTERLGFDNVVVENASSSIDLEAVMRLVADDAAVKGMWLVPRYSNPEGWTLSADVVHALASMRTAAPDFRIFWDDAYCVHGFSGRAELARALEACAGAGNPDRVFVFGSTSKITFAGSGLAAWAGSRTNREWLLHHRFAQTIGPNKLNQLRHVAFLRDLGGVLAHMARHAELIRPKFEAVDRVLTEQLGGTDLATWTRPEGGYFVSLDVHRASARRVVELAASAGVKLTPAGATYPGSDDPNDRNLRIAPTFPSVGDLEVATEVLALAVRLAADR